MDNKDKQLLSMTQLFDTGKIYWIKSLPTLTKWVMRDIKHRNLLKTIVRKNNGRGNRYYFNPENVNDYVKAFEDGKLDHEQ